METVFPELVSIGPDGMKALNYTGLIPVLLEAIKEQQDLITELSIRHNEQQAKIEKLIRSGTVNDYGEYFSSLDGREIHKGISVLLEKGKIRPALKGEVPMGIISDESTITGGAHLEWPGKYLHDEFGRQIMEEYKEEILASKKQKVKKERQRVDKKSIVEEVIRTEIVKNYEGKYIRKVIKEKVTREIQEPVFEEVDLYDETGKNIIGKHRIPVMETYEEEEEKL